MRREMKARLGKLIGLDTASIVVIVHNALPPDGFDLVPYVGDTFSDYRNRVVADGKSRGLQRITVSAWYGADVRPYDGDWLGG